jgi:tRNA(Ile)-lysidine synthase
MASREVDAVATAHTLDDQAETVLGKLIRGAWTEGISGIHPVVDFPEGQILRPMLATTRSQVERYLAGLGQTWVEDASNADLAFTRNRIRHDLLPQLNQWNPRIREHFSQMAVLARDEELFWQAEIARLAPHLLLTGRPVRGGGRAASEESTIALDVVRLAALPAAVQRRLLRYVAGSLGVSLDFDATEALRRLGLEGRAGQQLALPGPLTAERSPRELRITRQSPKIGRRSAEVQLPVPGENAAFGWKFRAQSDQPAAPAIIRNWRPGDRVTLRYSSGPRKIKEVLERMKICGTERAEWPVVEWQGQIVWMQGADLVSSAGIIVTAEKGKD